MEQESPEARRLPDIGEDHYTFAGEIPWCDSFSNGFVSTVDFVVGWKTLPVKADDPRYLRFVVNVGGVEHIIGPPKVPKFERVPVYKRIAVYVPSQKNNSPSGAGIERPGCVVLSKELANHFKLSLDLPGWDMIDDSGQRCSIVADVGEYWDYERLLFIREDLIDSLLKSQNLGLVWVVWGERQHFSTRLANENKRSAGYKYFQQLYRYVGKGRVTRVS
jgi:hypothetical protein